jgi:hypothetical protein
LKEDAEAELVDAGIVGDTGEVLDLWAPREGLDERIGGAAETEA